jgi:NADPH:quinone reductase-like Zn-dependent oxidoreductase
VVSETTEAFVLTSISAIVTSSSGDKLSEAKELGADYLINYRENPEWQEEVMKLTDGKGVDVIFEQGGPATLAKSFNCVKWGGMISCIGYLSGKQDVGDKIVNTNVLALRRNVTLKGIWNGPKDRLEEAIEVYDTHSIKPVIDRTFAFDEAREAFKYVAAGSHFGKVIVKV